MKILLVHNFYQQPGGEDVVFEQERQLLERHGNSVVVYTRSNSEAENLSTLVQLKTIVFASQSKSEIAALIKRESPDVVHIHNILMMISPSIYDACVEAQVPTVQTLHNYRLLCPAVTFYRDNHNCEECVDHSLLRGVLHGCYRGSRAATSAVALMLKISRMRGVWSQKVDAYIVLTQFAKEIFAQNGLPPEKLYVKPNFVDPDPGTVSPALKPYAVFAGRLSHEKGASVLLAAWGLLKTSIPLRIVGDGPERMALEQQAKQAGVDVEFLGRLSNERSREVIRSAGLLVLPSVWYEGLPMVLVESYACGVPVLGSRLGAIEELIEDGQTGLYFAAGDPEDLAEKATWLFEHPDEMTRMGRTARERYLKSYGAEGNYVALMDIYTKAIDRHRQGRREYLEAAAQSEVVTHRKRPVGDLVLEGNSDDKGEFLLFLGLARNCEATLPNFLGYLDDLEANGLKTTAIVGENASSDRTPEILASARSTRLEVLNTSMMAGGSTRLVRMAIGRQALLERAQSLRLGETYICVADMDNVMLKPPDPSSVSLAIKRLREDRSLFAVGATSYPVYYDLLALRTSDQDYSTLHTELVEAKKNPFTYFQFHKRRIYQNQRLMTVDKPVPCASTFNGFCIYRAEDYYRGSYRDPAESVICEHVSLNLSIGHETGRHMLVLPELRLEAPEDHRPVGFFEFWAGRVLEQLRWAETRFGRSRS